MVLCMYLGMCTYQNRPILVRARTMRTDLVYIYESSTFMVRKVKWLARTARTPTSYDRPRLK